MVAASAICLARVTLNVRPYWTPELQDLSAYDASAVRACIVELHSLHRKACSAQLRAVFDKYAAYLPSSLPTPFKGQYKDIHPFSILSVECTSTAPLPRLSSSPSPSPSPSSRYATPDRLAVSSLTPPETLPLVLDNAAF